MPDHIARAHDLVDELIGIGTDPEIVCEILDGVFDHGDLTKPEASELVEAGNAGILSAIGSIYMRWTGGGLARWRTKKPEHRARRERRLKERGNQ